MSMIEIVLIIVGAIVLCAGYFLPAKKEKEDTKVTQIDEEHMKLLVEKEINQARGKIDGIVEETIQYAMEKAERSMERVSNEKIMAVNEYSDTVLSEINKNHEEVVFLYDMLNNKHENLKNTVSEVDKTAKEVKETLKDMEISVQELTVEMEQTKTSVPEDKVIEKVEEEPEFEPINPKVVKVLPPIEEGDDMGQELQMLLAKNAKKKTVTKRPKAGAKVTKSAKQTADVKEKPVEVNDIDMDIEFHKGNTGNRNNNDRILELHQAGKSNMAIAKELGLGIGEVKLVIDLFQGMKG